MPAAGAGRGGGREGLQAQNTAPCFKLGWKVTFLLFLYVFLIKAFLCSNIQRMQEKDISELLKSQNIIHAQPWLGQR